MKRNPIVRFAAWVFVLVGIICIPAFLLKILPSWGIMLISGFVGVVMGNLVGTKKQKRRRSTKKKKKTRKRR